jgi:TonB family protein
MKLVLENKDGKAVRTFMVNGDEATVVSRKDTRRVEVVASVAALDAKKVKYETIGQFKKADIEKKSIAVGDTGKLRLVSIVGEVARNNQGVEEIDDESWYKSLGIVAALFGVFLIVLHFSKFDEAKLAQEQKQQIVQIVKRIPPVQKVKPVVQQHHEQKQVISKTQRVVVTKKTASVKRLGALAVFGSMSSGKQRGGINLGQVNTSAGPGLGGKQGSGGVQTTLYGKGLVAAPLGAGSNMQGGGGYGTKGKGGGKAGYGKMSLVGSAGTSTIPLGREALVEGGLDRDLIADVINRHMGQFRFCYEQGLQGSPGLAGRVAVRFTIGSNGQVKSAGIDNTTMNSSMVESCVVNRMRSLKFPLPEGGVDVKVSYPFMFRRTGQG